MIKKLFRFYVLSNIHVALSVLSLSYLTLLYLDTSWQIDLFIFTFFSTVVTYNFIRYYSSLSIKSRLNMPLLVFSFISVLGTGFSATKLATNTLLAASLLGIMSFTYVLPSNRFFLGLRYLPYLKSFFVAACWASVVVILPMLNYQIEFNRKVGLIWLQMALWTFSTMIPFEIRDISNDSESMKTIPQVFGVRGAKIIGSLTLNGVVVLSYFLSQQSYDMFPTIIACVSALVCLWKATVDQSTYFASFWVEALPMVWLLMVVIWKWI